MPTYRGSTRVGNDVGNQTSHTYASAPFGSGGVVIVAVMPQAASATALSGVTIDGSAATKLDDLTTTFTTDSASTVNYYWRDVGASTSGDIVASYSGGGGCYGCKFIVWTETGDPTLTDAALDTTQTSNVMSATVVPSSGDNLLAAGGQSFVNSTATWTNATEDVDDSTNEIYGASDSSVASGSTAVTLTWTNSFSVDTVLGVVAYSAASGGSAGSASGTGTASGVGASTAASAGSSSGTGAGSGAGASTAATDGTAAGAATVSGAGASGTVADGSAAGTSTVTGAAASTAASDAAATGTGAATGAAVSTAEAAGSSAGVATVSGAGSSTSDGQAVGTASGAATVSGAGASTAEASGSATGTASVSGAGAPAGGATSAPGGWYTQRDYPKEKKKKVREVLKLPEPEAPQVDWEAKRREIERLVAETQAEQTRQRAMAVLERVEAKIAEIEQDEEDAVIAVLVA